MNNFFMYLKVRIKQDATLAVDLAEKSPSIRNFNLANKILAIKLTSEKLKLNKESNDTFLIKKKITNYKLLSLRLNEIKKEYIGKDKCIVELRKSLIMKKIEDRRKEKFIEYCENRRMIYDFSKKDTNINYFINKKLMSLLIDNKKLNNGDFYNCDLKDNNISDADICDSRFENCNLNEFEFTKCKLNQACFSGSKIKNTTFNKCDLTNANFLLSNIENVNFINSDLSSAKIKVKSASFENSTLDNAKIEFDIDNIISIENKNSLFETIRSIDDKYHEIKTSLMSALISKIKDNNIGLSMKYLLENIFSNKYFCQDKIIKNFITDILYASDFNEEYSNSFDKLPPDFLSFHLDLIDNYDNNKLKSFMLKNNNNFIKLMVLSLYHENQNVRDKSRALYDKYLDLEEIKSFVEKNGIDCGDRVVDWYDKSSFNYILINRDKDKKIIINHEDIVNILFNDNVENNTSWNKFYLYIGNKCQISNNINYYELFMGHELLDDYKIPDFVFFKNNYEKSINRIESNKWLSLFESSDFYKQFHSVLIGMKPSSNENFINIIQQENLAETFRPFLNVSDDNIKKTSLNIEHYQKLCEVFDITLANNELKSQYLLSLSALIVKYSSSSVFGTASDSPEILRKYAYALMNKANELNPKLMGEHFDEWSDKLLGLNNRFECTDTLFSKMNDYGKKHFQNIFYKIIPLHWR